MSDAAPPFSTLAHDPARGEAHVAVWFAGAMALMPVLAVLTPFGFSVAPPMFGILGWLALAACRRRLPPFDTVSLAIAAGIFTLSTASLLWSDAPHVVQVRVVKTLPLLLALILIVPVAKGLPAEGLKRGMRLFPYCVMLGFAVLDMELTCHMPLYRFLNHLSFDKSVAGAVMNRSIISMTLFVFPALAMIWIDIKEPRRRALMCAGLAVAALPTLLLTESQSTQVALLGGFLCFFIVPLRFKWMWQLLFLGLVVYMAIFPGVAILTYPYQAVVDASPYFGEHAGFGGERMEIWHGVAEKVMQHPWVGYGAEATRAMHFDFRKYFPNGTVLHPHNLALQIWIEFGVLGVMLTCAALGRLLYTVCITMHGMTRRAALPTLMMCLLIGSTAYGMWQGWWIGLLILLSVHFAMMRSMEEQAVEKGS